MSTLKSLEADSKPRRTIEAFDRTGQEIQSVERQEHVFSAANNEAERIGRSKFFCMPEFQSSSVDAGANESVKDSAATRQAW